MDKSFVSELGRNATAASIIRSIVGLCADLGIGCGVGGVETEKQRAILQDLGCRWMQGYLFSKPMAPTDLATFLAEDGPASGARPRISVTLS
jgi:EAL domain-containing protein (putative c-di-GMP-specific phosphodiesterase class I)